MRVQRHLRTSAAARLALRARLGCAVAMLAVSYVALPPAAWSQSVLADGSGEHMVEAQLKPGQAWIAYRTQLVRDLPTKPAALLPGGGSPPATRAATGYFRVEKIGPRWWFVDPEGALFLSAGMNAVTTYDTLGQRVAKRERFGSNADWARGTVALLRAHGFNTLGNWSDLSSLQSDTVPDHMPHTRQLAFLTDYAKQEGQTSAGTGHLNFRDNYLPVFAPGFAAYCDQRARSLAAFQHDHALLGYFSDNELPASLNMLDTYLALPEQPAYMGSGRQAAWDWLRQRKGAAVESGDITDEDRARFVGVIYERYYQVVAGAIRKYDPHHLYLGSRLYNDMAKKSPHIVEAAGKYADVISFNLYQQWSPSPTDLANWTAWSGRPVLISEFYAKGNDSGLGNLSGAGWVVRTQAERGQFYQNFVLGLMASQTVIGWHWHRYMDNDPDDRKTDPSNRDANKGIVNKVLAPYEPLLSAMAELNLRQYEIVKAAAKAP